MAGIPKYNIVPCCPDSGTQIEQFHIPDGPDGLVPNGVYVYNGLNTVINGITFETGYCYTIQGAGSNFATLPDAPSYNDFSLVEDCLDEQCIACKPALPNAYQVYACCDSANVIMLNIDDADITTNGVYSYDGTLPLTIGGFTFEPDQCYKIEYVGNAVETAGPFLSTFTFQGVTCELTENCPACPTTPQYLRYASCCDSTVLYFRPYSTGIYTEGVYEYLGLPVNGLENICYSLTIEDVGVAPIDDISEYGALPEAPDFIENVTFDTLSDTNTNCTSYTLECPSCKKTCYTLYNCDGLFFNTTSDVSAYVGEFVTISNNDGPVAGTWYVLLNTGKCDAVEDITVIGLASEPCDCRCFEVTGNPTKITYIDCNGDLTSTSGADKFCSLVYPFVTGTPGEYQISEGSDCVDGECPILCYKLTNCDTGEVIYSTLQTLSQYVITSSIITLSGYEGCWQVNNLEQGEKCDCPVNVIVLQVFNSCQACLPVIAYKFTNCDNSALIQYSTNDYSEYVGKTVELECGKCWFVSEINITPPSTQDPVIQYVFDNCAACKANYYELSDCLDPNGAKVYTATDLSSYLEKIIKIEGCDKCFSISTTREPVNPTNVVVVNNYIDCPECLETFPCNCTQVSNTTTETQTYCYLDCDFNEQSIILEPGETSDKICVIDWITCKSGNCNCLEGFISTDDVQIILKFDKTDVIKNGKPVYTSLLVEDNTSEISFSLSYESDNCWYIVSSGNVVIPFPVLKLCNNSNCPTGEWEQVIDCIRFDAQITIDGVPNVDDWFVTNVDNNGYYTYVTTSDNQILYSIKYNSTLNRWELFNDVNILIAYYNTENSCPITDKPEAWTSLNENTSFLILNDVPVEPTQLTVAECQTGCNCIFYELTIPDGGNATVYGVLENTGTIINNKPVYISNALGEIPIEIFWDNITNCWIVSEIGGDALKGTLCNSSSDVCPIGTWEMDAVDELFSTEFCTDETTTIGTTTLPEYIQNFGSCIDGACPVEIFPKRKVKPGYNTPGCNPDEYDKITCKFSEVMYKVVLEKRYGITNCCLDDDEKWLLKKELINLQALKDPNYKCPSCSCSCNSGKTYSTCNCGN